MNAPQPVEYTTTTGHKVILSNKKQLIIEQGFPCIDGGHIKINGKGGRLAVRYDNKPELAAMVAVWQEKQAAYETWFAGLVEATKQAMTTNTRINFDKAETDEFSWTYYDGTSGKTLREKSTGREIYQMRYTDKNEAVTGETKEKAKAFWRALESLKEKPAPLFTGEEMARIEKIEFAMTEPKHGENGYCRKCHSYCWGDCEAN